MKLIPQSAEDEAADNEAIEVLKGLGAQFPPEAVRAMKELGDWSLQKAMNPMAMGQTFQAIAELDFASEVGKQLQESGDPESQLKGAHLVALAAKGRIEISKQLRVIGKESAPAKVQRERSNLPPDPRPVVINQQFLNSQPQEPKPV
jgi:hypothetical protein